MNLFIVVVVVIWLLCCCCWLHLFCYLFYICCCWKTPLTPPFIWWLFQFDLLLIILFPVICCCCYIVLFWCWHSIHLSQWWCCQFGTFTFVVFFIVGDVVPLLLLLQPGVVLTLSSDIPDIRHLQILSCDICWWWYSVIGVVPIPGRPDEPGDDIDALLTMMTDPTTWCRVIDQWSRKPWHCRSSPVCGWWPLTRIDCLLADRC